MNNNIVVQLFVSTDGEKGRIGTAYPVAEGVLLTAAHVVGDAKGSQVEARWFHQKGDAKQWRHCNEILWDGRKDHDDSGDALLLACEFPKEVSRHWGIIVGEPPKTGDVWQSEGFAFVGKRSGGDEPVPLQGKTYSKGDGVPHFHLQVDAAAAFETGWEGASGSPIFVGRSIIGVIVNVPGNFNAERFEAVPASALLDNPAFQKHVGFSEAADKRRKLMEAAIDVLSRDKLAMQALAKELSIKLVSDLEESAEKVVASLVEGSWIIPGRT